VSLLRAMVNFSSAFLQTHLVSQFVLAVDLVDDVRTSSTVKVGG